MPPSLLRLFLVATLVAVLPGTLPAQSGRGDGSDVAVARDGTPFDDDLARLSRRLRQARMQATGHIGDVREARRLVERLEPELERLTREYRETSARIEGFYRRRENTEQRAAYSELARQIGRDMSNLAATRARLESLYAKHVAPRGWLGVSYTATTEQRLTDDGVVMKHIDYPVVASVEPGSPASRAGIERGDVIVAYNGVDLRRREVNLTRLLVPRTRVAVRVRRGGEMVEIPVVVGIRRGAPYAVTMPGAMDVSGMLMDMPPEAELLPPLPPDPAVAPVPPRDRRSGVAVVTPPWPAQPADAPFPARPPASQSPYSLWVASAVAGAQVIPMNADLRDVFNVERGVLVTSVGEGTPAASAGLRAGDVIVSADGNAVSAVRQLQRVLERCEDRSVRLEIVRKQQRRTVALRW